MAAASSTVEFIGALNIYQAEFLKNKILFQIENERLYLRNPLRILSSSSGELTFEIFLITKIREKYPDLDIYLEANDIIYNYNFELKRKIEEELSKISKLTFNLVGLYPRKKDLELIRTYLSETFELKKFQKTITTTKAKEYFNTKYHEVLFDIFIIISPNNSLFFKEPSNSLILGSRNFLKEYNMIITEKRFSKEFIEEYYNMFYLMSSMFFSYLSKELILIYEVFPEGIPEIDIKDSYLTDTNFTDERMESYKIKNTLKRSLFNFSVDESTDYFQKYLKYKSKYLNLKTKINLSS